MKASWPEWSWVLEAQAWLTDVLKRIADRKITRLDELIRCRGGVTGDHA